VVQYFGFSIWRGKHVEKKIVDAQFMADWWSFDSGFNNNNEIDSGFNNNIFLVPNSKLSRGMITSNSLPDLNALVLYLMLGFNFFSIFIKTY
jgi:hypothetical protein